MTGAALAQKPPPSAPQPLPTEVQGQLSTWVAAGLGVVVVVCVVFMGWAFVEISTAREMGREPRDGVERVLVIAGVAMVASSIGAVVSLIYIPI